MVRSVLLSFIASVLTCLYRLFNCCLSLTASLPKWHAKLSAVLLSTLLLALPCYGKAASHPAKASTAPTSPTLINPDAALIDILKTLARNDLRGAELKVNALLEAYPHFQLAHLIRGDLLLMHTRPVTPFGAANSASLDKLKDLHDEASARIKAIYAKPDPDLIPRSILQLRDDQKHILVVDASKSRLYVYQNIAGQPKFLTDYYISQGKLGINKTKKGDQRTPLGLYYITSRLPGAKLPDFYGPGALPLNYPNEWDKINGRSGSGIWLHGVPSDNFSRPPLASDGCVVLSNGDFLKLSEEIDIGKTPVIINERVEFVNRTKWLSDKSIANKLLEDWRLDVESHNINRILGNYSKKFKTLTGDDLSTWFSKQQTVDKFNTLSVKLNDVSQFRYPGKEELLVMTFTQENLSGKNKSSLRKRQYWIKENAKWQIIYESPV